MRNRSRRHSMQVFNYVYFTGQIFTQAKETAVQDWEIDSNTSETIRTIVLSLLNNLKQWITLYRNSMIGIFPVLEMPIEKQNICVYVYTDKERAVFSSYCSVYVIYINCSNWLTIYDMACKDKELPNKRKLGRRVQGWTSQRLWAEIGPMVVSSMGVACDNARGLGYS